MVSSHIEHRDSYWNTIDSSGRVHPPEEFWVERFLVRDGDKRMGFSLEGMQGKWMPYGMGEHICPGRHFAKYEMLLSFAVVVDRYDVEVLGRVPEDNLGGMGLVLCIRGRK